MQDEMTINERRKYVKLMYERYRKAKRQERSQLLSEMEQVTKMHRKSLTRLLNGQSLERKKREPCAPPELWAGSGADRVARLGEPGLHLCRTTHPQSASPGEASGRLWSAEAESRAGGAIAEHQYQHSATDVAQASLRQRALTAQRTRTGEPADQRCPDGAHPLGHQGARAFRGRLSAAQWPACEWGVWAYLAADRCGDRLE